LSSHRNRRLICKPSPGASQAANWRINKPTADVLWLRYVVGLTAHQTVEVLGRSERTVRREWLFGIGWLREERAAQ
jgi:hypothetical protein